MHWTLRNKSGAGNSLQTIIESYQIVKCTIPSVRSLSVGGNLHKAADPRFFESLFRLNINELTALLLFGMLVAQEYTAAQYRYKCD
jgi:hypothetical protein